MDLTINLEQNNILNIRVAIICQTENGYLLEKNKKGFYFFLGGRVKLGESSLQAAKREFQEETGLDIHSLEYVSTIENFYENVHEICFVYKTGKIEGVDPKYGLVEFKKEEMKDLDIRPSIIKDIIMQEKEDTITHFIV
jgi:8-oxo-dGTP pyrophosphatase MutT (NUDIX family)